MKRLKPRLGFFSAKHFSFGARKRIIQSTFLPILDYGDVIYMHASTYLLKRLDGVYHAALRFITNACSSRTHHCLLYIYAGWSSLCQRTKSYVQGSRFLYSSNNMLLYILERHCWVCFQITLLVFYAYVERTIAPDHQVGLN